MLKPALMNTVKRSLNKFIRTQDKVRGIVKMRLRGGFDNGSGITPYQDAEAGNMIIRHLLLGKEPALIARHGLYELRAFSHVIRNDSRYKDKAVLARLHINAGFFPFDTGLLNRFATEYGKASTEIDCLCAWCFRHGMFEWEESAFRDYCPKAHLTDIDATNFYLFSNPWTSSLKDMRVLVIHPFADLISAQYLNREHIFENEATLPTFKSLETIQAVQSIAGNPTEYDDWFTALNHMKSLVDNKNFDVALIGAGAYGLPLGAHVKSIGKKAVHMGGVTQILFGIMGTRWENTCSHLFNEFWTRPSSSDRPRNYDKVEGGCYW